jgi:NADH-quinone oxidoreductase subunit E
MGDDAILQASNEHALNLEGFAGKPGELITLLQYLQRQYGYISKDGVRQVARFLKISENQIYGVASFYSQFRFQKPGDHTIRVCQGTACHVQGGDQLSQEARKILGVNPGETTADGRFDFQEVACLGCCAQASVVEIDGRVYGKITPDTLRKVLKDHENL